MSLYDVLGPRWAHVLMTAKLAKVTRWLRDSADKFPAPDIMTQNLNEANVFSSEIADGTEQHRVVIDIDKIPVLVRESTTPGNYHLVIDKAMSWPVYRDLLDALRDAGIIQEGYYQAAIARHASYLRLPWISK